MDNFSLLHFSFSLELYTWRKHIHLIMFSSRIKNIKGIFILKYTHRYDTSNIYESSERDNCLKKAWIILSHYFCRKACQMNFRYWPGDYELSQNPDYVSTTLGLKSLLQYITKVSEIDHCMEEISVPVIAETIQILLQENNTNIINLVSPWFHVELINTDGDTIFYSGDYGSDILMILTDYDIQQLTNLGLEMNSFIRLPEM